MRMDKPKYKVPTMAEIEARKKNGYKVASTFSGGGGSCLGYRMAGYEVVYANEFIPEAQETYRANNPHSYLDSRDIRTVTGKDIMRITGIEQGALDIFDGSPPCSAFSTAGSREKGWGKSKKYSDTEQRVDDLFFEYVRIMNELQPKVFIAENVAGLVRGKAKGYFKIILKALQDCGYTVGVQLINAMWLGVPQRRERIIFVGVRNDLVKKYGVKPEFPAPFEYYYTIADAWEDLAAEPEETARLREDAKKYSIYKILLQMQRNPKRPIQGDSITGNSYFNLIRESLHCPCSTICQSHGASSTAGSGFHPVEIRKFTINELKRVMSMPDDFIVTGNFKKQWERLGRMVPPVMMKNISETIQEKILDRIEG